MISLAAICAISFSVRFFSAYELSICFAVFSPVNTSHQGTVNVMFINVAAVYEIHKHKHNRLVGARMYTTRLKIFYIVISLTDLFRAIPPCVVRCTSINSAHSALCAHGVDARMWELQV